MLAAISSPWNIVTSMFCDCYNCMEKPDLHIVVTIAEHTYDDVSKRILSFQINDFLNNFLREINNCDHYKDMETKPYLDSLKYMFASICLRSLRLYGDQALWQ